VRTLFLLIVLANVAFFAWTQFIAGGGSGADPAPLSRQIEPEKMHVVSSEEAARLSAPKPAAVAAVSPPAATPAPTKCLEWGSFAPADLARAQKALEPLALGERLAQRKTDELPAWWVFIPPQAQVPDPRQAALRKAGELKKLGVQDYFIVQEEGPNRWAVSLGVFRSEEAAQARLAALRDQGVRSARIGAREAPLPKVWLQVKNVDPGLEAKLQEIAREVSGSELRECVP
jgi:hypothetical protein